MKTFLCISTMFFLMAFSFIYWRKACALVLIWIAIVGIFRKWITPEYSDLLFFSPNAILAGAYFRMLGASKRNVQIPKPITVVIISLLIWSALGLASPRLPDIRIGLLGMITHFYFIPLAILTVYSFSSLESFNRFINLYCLLSIPLLILGVIQYLAPEYSLLNQYARASDIASIAKVGSHARITSTFPYIAGYTTYLQILNVFLMYSLLQGERKNFTKATTIALILFTIINMFMTGSRMPIVIAVFSYIILLISLRRMGFYFAKKYFSHLLLLSTIFLVLIHISPIAQESFENFNSRAQEAKDVERRLIDTFTPFKFLDQAGLTGYGIGTTYQGARRLGRRPEQMTDDFEEEPERIVLELGLVGFCLVYLLRLLLLLRAWKLYRTLRNVRVRFLALCCFTCQAPFFLYSVLVFNQTANIYYWFITGIIYLLPTFDRQINAQATAVPLRSPN